MRKYKQFILILLSIGAAISFYVFKKIYNPVLIDVPLICQYPKLPTGCESVAATMLLQYYGIPITETSFASDWLSSSNDFYEYNGNLYGPDPYKVFVGDPFSEYSYGCFAPVIVHAINNNQNRVTAVMLENMTLDEICTDYTSKGQPVLIWATMCMKPAKQGNSWYLPSNKNYTWIAGEHCLVLVGYDNWHYYLNDPQTGKVVIYKKELVKSRFEELGSQAIICVYNNK